MGGGGDGGVSILIRNKKTLIISDNIDKDINNDTFNTSAANDDNE